MSSDFDFHDDSRMDRRRARGQGRGRGAGRGALLFFGVIGLVIAAGVGYLAWDRLGERHDRQRLPELNAEWLREYNAITTRESTIRDQSPRLRKMDPEVMGVERNEAEREEYEKDPEWRRLHKKINEIEAERSQILRRHPEWK